MKEQQEVIALRLENPLTFHKVLLINCSHPLRSQN